MTSGGLQVTCRAIVLNVPLSDVDQIHFGEGHKFGFCRFREELGSGSHMQCSDRGSSNGNTRGMAETLG